jgi:hypothetical protein
MMVSDLVDARIEQEKKITLLKAAAKEAGISMTGLKDVYFGNMLTMSQGDVNQALESMKAMSKKSPPLLEGMDEDIPAGEDMTMT